MRVSDKMSTLFRANIGNSDKKSLSGTGYREQAAQVWAVTGGRAHGAAACMSTAQMISASASCN